MSDKTICRRHFKNLGFKGSYNQTVLDYIIYKFDVFKNNDETKLVYVLEKESSFSSIVDAAVIIMSSKPHLSVCLCVPHDYKLPIEAQHKASGENFELYIIKGRRVDLLNKGYSKKIVEKHTINEIQKTLTNINRISKSKWEFSLFKIKKNLLNKLSPLAQNEKEFIYQITSISSIMEAINFKELKKHLNSTSDKEKKIINQSQSIGMIELFLKEKNIEYNPSLITNMRDLRDLRNMPPVHQSEKSKKICRRYINKLPTGDNDYSELSEIAFKIFRGTLILLRDELK